MAVKTIKQMNEDARSLLTEAKAIYDKGEDATPEELDAAAAKTADAERISEELTKYADGAAAKVANRIENTLALLNRPDRPAVAGGGGSPESGHDRHAAAVKTAGDTFISDPVIAAWLKQFEGRLADRLGSDGPAVALKALVYSGSTTTGGPFVWSDQRRDLVVPAPFRPFTLLDLIRRLDTTSDTIEYVRITGYTNAAAPVAEATAATGVTGLKPESAMLTAKVTDRVRTIAHWIPATTRVLSDAPQIRSIIDQFLRDGLQEELEDQVIAGNGAGENLPGILNTPGLTAQPYVATGTPLLTTTRKARTAVRVVGRAVPTAYVFHPADWEALDLLQDAENRYYFGGPREMMTPRLWGLTVAESEAMPPGRALCGDMRQCVLWDRMQTAIYVGTINDDFIRNLIRILAEMRAGFGVLRPAAIVDIDLTAA